MNVQFWVFFAQPTTTQTKPTVNRLREDIFNLENLLETTTNETIQKEQDFKTEKQQLEEEIDHLSCEIEALRGVLDEKEVTLSSVQIEKDELISEVFRGPTNAHTSTTPTTH